MSCASVGDVVPIQIGRRQDRIFVGSGDHLLEDGIGDAIVDHQFLLPGPFAVTRIDGVQNRLHFFVNGLAEIFSSKFHTRLYQSGVLLDGKIRVFIFVVQNPALPFGHYLIAEFFGCEFVSPFSERSLGEFLNVSLVHQGHAFAAALKRKLNRHAHQTLGSRHRNRLYAHAGIQADLFLATLQHLLIKKPDEPRGFRCSLLPLDASIDIFCILSIDDDIHAFRMFHR